MFIPFTIGGGIRSVADAQAVLDAGADKVSVNSAALARPQLLDELAANFGAQCVVLAIDAKAAATDPGAAAAAASTAPAPADCADPAASDSAARAQRWDAYVAGG